LRGAGPHVRGCFVVDACLQRAPAEAPGRHHGQT
jgi:hypothetical protein